ncbi:MAG TPA: hypothetical protein VFW12_02390, partial [Candidatus Limnocylindria bacterium]|nr:hypothetical protein [Candidatus Limnocylindria bacterium]
STGGGTTGTTTGSGSSESTTTGGSTTTDTQSEGGVTVRTETTTVVEGDQQVRIIRIFRNDVLVNEIRTPLGAVAGFESAPDTAVAGSQTAPAGLLALASLPATSTSPDAALGLIGLAISTLGAALLRRPGRRT